MKYVPITIAIAGMVTIIAFAAWWSGSVDESEGRIKLAARADGSNSRKIPGEDSSARVEPIAATSASAPGGPRTGVLSPNPPQQPYAPVIQSILDSRDGKRAMYAVQKLDWCENIDSLAETAFNRKDTVEEARLRTAYAQVSAHFQEEQRACQSLTPELKSSRTELLKLANIEKTPGAGYKYLALGKGIEAHDPEAWSAALANAVADAKAGDEHSIQILALEGANYRIPKEDQWAYAIAAGAIQNGEQGFGSEMANQLIRQGFTNATPPSGTPSDVVKRVEMEAQAIVDAYRSQRSKRP